jgi:dienelactone hydrolase
VHFLSFEDLAMRYPLSAVAALFAASSAFAELKTAEITYKHGDVELQGYLSYDDSVAGKRPGVLVAHEWYGCNAYAHKRADDLAKLGYVAFALDMYGKGEIAKDAKEAAEKAAKFKGDRALMRARASAGLDILRRQPNVDPEHLGAIGYCFGGTTVLELARGGADLVGVVSFHGGLDTPNADDAKKIKGKVLVLHGADDPFVKKEEVAAFEDEMKKAKVDYTLVQYPGAVHAFTNPGAGDDNSKGAAYNEDADKKSFQAMKELFEKVFAKK